MITTARRLLDERDCTLAIVNHGECRKLYRRGVADLLDLLDNDPCFLDGASVADKIIGKGAAALMIVGKVKEVYTRVITHDALLMLEKAGIATTCELTVDIVENRSHTGRCPIDTLCAKLSDAAEMVDEIRRFVSRQSMKS